MIAEKVISIDQIDEIIPMIQKLHAGTIDKYVNLTGFLAWMSLNLPLSHFNVWKLKKDDKLVGYVVAEITQRYFVRECMVVDAYVEINDPEFSREMYQFIEDWATVNECKIFSCYTHRPEALCRKYKFDVYGTLLMKRIGD